MKKFLAAAVMASTVAIAAPASATTILLNTFGTGNFNADHGTGLFTDDYDFVVPGAGTVGSSVITLTLGGPLISLTQVLLNGQSLAVTFDGVKTYSATGTVLTQANPQTLSISGKASLGLGTGSYTGQVKFTPSAVPEPATWALMILGFGVVGYAMRRRPAVRFAQAI